MYYAYKDSYRIVLCLRVYAIGDDGTNISIVSLTENSFYDIAVLRKDCRSMRHPGKYNCSCF